MSHSVHMTLGGAAIVVAYTLFAVLLALVVVVAAAWTQLDGRRTDDDRTGRALAAVMPRVEAALARGRSLAEDGTERTRAWLVRTPRGERLRGAGAAGLDAVARGAASLSGRLAVQRAADPTASAPAVPPAQHRSGTGAPEAGARRVGAGQALRAEDGADDGRDRLPASFRNRLVS